MNFRSGQISAEYMIIIAFVMFIVITTLGVALFYGAEIQDAIRFSQLERFARQTIDAAESVQYGGEPSRATVSAYLPEGIKAVEISGRDIIFNVTTQHGQARLAYSSAVALQGTVSSSSGVKRLMIVAGSNAVDISSS
jgi:hypothetical protein